MNVEASAQLVNTYLAKGQLSSAIALCRQVLQLDTQRWEFYPLLGIALARQGNIAEAITAYHHALQGQPAQADVHANLGMLYSEQLKLDKAIWHYRQASLMRPDWAELHYNLAVVLHRLGDWHSAIENYQRAVTLKPDYVRAYFNLGVLYDQRGQLLAAEDSYRRSIANQPDYLRAYSNLGSVLVKQNQWQEAVQLYEQALTVDPGWATLHNNLGQIWQIQGKLDQAISAYRRAIELQSNLAIAHYNLGRLWQQQGNYPAAVECFERLLALEPQNVNAYSECGVALLAQGKISPALDCWRKAIALQPTFVEAYCQRAQLTNPEDLLGCAKFACAQFLEALQQHFDLPKVCKHLWQTHFYLGNVLQEYGAYEQAITHYQQALQLQPNQVDLYSRLGDCLSQEQRLDAAIATYHLGLELQPQHAQILLKLANLLTKQRRLEQAIDYYEQVVQLQNVGMADKFTPLSTLLSASEHKPPIPESIYTSTLSWFLATELDNCQYFSVTTQQSPVNKENAPLQPDLKAKNSEEACGGVTCRTCMNRLCSYFQPIQVTRGVYFCSPSQTVPVTVPGTFIVTIPGGRGWIAPQKSDWMICHAIAILTPDECLLGDLSRNYPWYLPGCQNHNQRKHPLFTQEQMPALKQFEGTVAVLSSLSGHVYYHWMIDVLPRLKILQAAGFEWENIDWFVVNSSAQAFQRETLQTLNVPSEKIISSDQYPYFQAQQLIVPSFPGHLDWVPQETIQFLRSTFLTPRTNIASADPKRIYISRAKAKYRQVLNEADVIGVLEKWGFTIISLEALGVAQQAALFNHAQVIVAPHGAGLTNLVFCQPGTTVIEFFSPRYIRSDYWMISLELGLNHYYLTSESFDCYPIRQLMYQNPLTEDILVNLNTLVSALQNAGLD